VLRRALFTIFIFFNCWASAQEFPSELWHEGKVVLFEGDTLKGNLRYSQETDILEYVKINGSTAIAFSAKKVLYFEIFDRTSNRYREFYALPFAVTGDYETPIMFEVILAGDPITVLSRERIEYRVVNNPYSMAGSYNRMELVYTYYLINKKGKIQQFQGTKKDLIWMLKDKSSEVKKYIKANRLRMDRRSDFIRVIQYYNSFFNKQNP
jgi:hypothetical protein